MRRNWARKEIFFSFSSFFDPVHKRGKGGREGKRRNGKRLSCQREILDRWIPVGPTLSDEDQVIWRENRNDLTRSECGTDPNLTRIKSIDAEHWSAK